MRAGTEATAAAAGSIGGVWPLSSCRGCVWGMSHTPESVYMLRGPSERSEPRHRLGGSVARAWRAKGAVGRRKEDPRSRRCSCSPHGDVQGGAARLLLLVCSGHRSLAQLLITPPVKETHRALRLTLRSKDIKCQQNAAAHSPKLRGEKAPSQITQ